MTGSLIVPLKAIILNILSLSATFGGLVWIFQDGNLQSLLHFETPGSIDPTQPVLIFAIAFGLSMDYEVFVLSRIKESFDKTGNNRQAVSEGIQSTGWLVTSAALLLAIVLLGFGSAKTISIQEIGIGLTLAVMMDAVLIRSLLLPATMRLLGTLNWWAPAPLHWLWKYIGLKEVPQYCLIEKGTGQGQVAVPALLGGNFSLFERYGGVPSTAAVSPAFQSHQTADPVRLSAGENLRTADPVWSPRLGLPALDHRELNALHRYATMSNGLTSKRLNEQMGETKLKPSLIWRDTLDRHMSEIAAIQAELESLQADFDQRIDAHRARLQKFLYAISSDLQASTSPLDSPGTTPGDVTSQYSTLRKEYTFPDLRSLR
jgi:hypothetical protein